LYNPVNKIQEKYFRNLTQLSKNRGLPAWRGCFRSPDNGIFVSLRQGLMGEAGKTQGSSFLTVFFLNNVKNEDLTILTLRLFYFWQESR